MSDIRRKRNTAGDGEQTETYGNRFGKQYFTAHYNMSRKENQMGKVVLVCGESGSGKSASLRNFEPNEVGIFNASEKPLPFRKKLPMAMTGDYETIKSHLRKNNRNCYVLDDIGLTMAFYLFDKVNESGYGKFTSVAKNFYDLVQCAIKETSEDTIVYFIMHTERSDDGMKIKAKTAGKMIDSQLTLESLFSIVLFCVTDGRKHTFITQSDGVTTAKSPMEMFELEIDNDLKAVDTAIREYYGMAKIGTPVKKADKKAPVAAEVTTAKIMPGGDGN